MTSVRVSFVDRDVARTYWSGLKGVFPDEQVWLFTLDFIREMGEDTHHSFLWVEDFERQWARDNLDYQAEMSHRATVHSWAETRKAFERRMRP